MVVPSARVCVVSVTATAEYGAPVTTFPGCISSNPRIFMRAPNGSPAMNPSDGGGPGGGSCAFRAAPLQSTAAVKTDKIQFLFIPVSPLLLSCCFSPKRGERAARNSIARLRQAIGLRLAIRAEQQIHLHHVVRVLFIDRQSQRAKRAAFHLHPHYCRVVQQPGDRSGYQCEFVAIVFGNQGAAKFRPVRNSMSGDCH